MRKYSLIQGSKLRILWERGFTLIELIVVFTVIAILSAIGVVSYVSYSRSQTLNQAANDLVSTLNSAKSLSSSQLKQYTQNGQTKTCNNFETLSGYGVQINTSQEYYALYLDCSSTGVQTSTAWQVKLLPSSGIAFDTSDTNITDVFFPLLTGSIVTKGSGLTNQIVLKNVYSGNTKTIFIDQGYIRILP